MATKYDNFFTIVPRDKKYLDYNYSSIPLRVIQSDGVKFNPDVKFTITDMNNGYKHFKNQSGKGDSFTVSVLIRSRDKVTGTIAKGIDHDEYTATEEMGIYWLLNSFIKAGRPFYVHTSAVGISNSDLYIITENKERRQEFDDGWTVWSLTFTKYVALKMSTFKTKSTGVKKAINAWNKKKAKQKAEALKKAKEKLKTTAKYKLEHECKPSQIVYSATKKDVTCVRYMQQILFNKGFLKKKTDVNGWFNKTTYNALKEFQKKNKKKFNLKVTGKCDTKTFYALFDQAYGNLGTTNLGVDKSGKEWNQIQSNSKIPQTTSQTINLDPQDVVPNTIYDSIDDLPDNVIFLG